MRASAARALAAAALVDRGSRESSVCPVAARVPRCRARVRRLLGPDPTHAGFPAARHTALIEHLGGHPATALAPRPTRRKPSGPASTRAVRGRSRAAPHSAGSAGKARVSSKRRERLARRERRRRPDRATTAIPAAHRAPPPRPARGPARAPGAAAHRGGPPRLGPASGARFGLRLTSSAGGGTQVGRGDRADDRLPDDVGHAREHPVEGRIRGS